MDLPWKKKGGKEWKEHDARLQRDGVKMDNPSLPGVVPLDHEDKCWEIQPPSSLCLNVERTSDLASEISDH